MRWGRHVRSEWRLDPAFLTVNHGSFGATPICVRAEQDEWRERLEAQPTRFMAALPGLIRAAADRLGTFLGADGNDIVFTDNATTACNAVLRSLRKP
jgi:isopenicillin-N epimerase